MSKDPTYVTTRDIVIPAGTELDAPPRASSRWGKDYEAVVEVDRDHTCYLSIDTEEGLDAGFLKVKE